MSDRPIDQITEVAETADGFIPPAQIFSPVEGLYRFDNAISAENFANDINQNRADYRATIENALTVDAAQRDDVVAVRITLIG